MRLIILETGTAPGTLSQTYGTYGAMFERLLAPVFEHRNWGADIQIVQVHLGAALPDPASGDGYLITGSPAAVYDDNSWIKPLSDFIRTAVALGKPMVGICFGHQLMAQALGGEVRKSDKGWGVGVHKYDLVDDNEKEYAQISCVVSHQDQVVTLPPTATRLGGSAFCPNGIIAYGGSGLSFQMHPEFEHDFAADLLTLRQKNLPAAVVEMAKSSFDYSSDSAQIADWILKFFINTQVEGIRA